MEAKLAGKEEEFNMEQKINELKEKFGELDAQQIIDLIKQEDLLKISDYYTKFTGKNHHQYSGYKNK